MDSRRRTTSYDIPRVSALPRLLRLRADEKLRKMLQIPPEGEPGAGRLEVPSREPLARGEVIRVEISLGPMADEVVLKGSVSEVTPRENHSPLVVIEIDPKHEERSRYVAAVMAEERPATARRYRRVAAAFPVTWRNGLFTYHDHTADISQGGAFVGSSQKPDLGHEFVLDVDLPSGTTLSLRSSVVWNGTRLGLLGFGVRFVERDRGIAETLAEVVRTIEDRDFR